MSDRRYDTPPPPPPPEEHVGPRRAALEQRRKEKRRRAGLLGAGAGVAIVIAVALIAVVLSGDGGAPPPPSSVATPEGEDALTTTLLFGTRETSDLTTEAVWLALLSFDADRDRGAVVYIPAHTAVEISGRGLHALGDALKFGNVPLLLVSAQTLLGIEIDRYAELSDNDAQVLFEATGPVTVNVPSEVRVPAGRGQVRLLFTDGVQEIDPDFLVRLLYTTGVDQDDVELGTRHLAFWDALFEQFADDPRELARAVREAGAALGESDARPAAHADFLQALAALADDRRTLGLLPVNQVSVGGGELYETDFDEIRDFLRQNVGVAAVEQDEVRVQILNGNGEPGIGQEVAEILTGEGFRVVLSDNARNFDYEETLVITYDSSAEGQQVAERARDLLGVGRVQVSAQSQGIVDLTIVVGRDFLNER
ncbi:MAG: LCP family protein [Actinomycetota bacterium]